ncbi:hypothetical protein AKO1_011250 [Acrasis kona]|uniref:Methenyltetrahydrofolate cyclohydrolase n=1 Tax=Acrasis kona TaxID=1008807 RepID=A0AAW2YVJ7_9EUKA
MAPGLAVLLVGDRKDSSLYVELKKKTALKLGFNSFVVKLEEESSLEQILNHIDQFNKDTSVHGILVQLPLPKHIDPALVLRRVDVNKDVDGLHPQGAIFQPCTPKGCLELLDRSNIDVSGKDVVVLGRSRVVGLPLSLLLTKRNATVTLCHSRSQQVKQKAQRADILISACGVPELVRGDWIKPGAVVVDVGINHIPDHTKGSGYRIVGDVCFEEAYKVASHITPVPGGVGPMTIAMLMHNTWLSFITKVQDENSCK